jgi:hypothetical protein
MGIFEDYARKKEAERQGMYDDVTAYFSGQGLVPAAGRMAKEAIVSIPDAAKSIRDYAAETYDTGGENVLEDARGVLGNYELRNALSLQGQGRDIKDAAVRAVENKYPDTPKGSEEQLNDYLTVTGAGTLGAVGALKAGSDVLGAVTPDTRGPSTPTDPSRRKFGQDVGAAAVTAAVAPSLLGNFAKKAAVGTAAAGAATSLGASVARLKGLSDKFEKAFDSYGDGDPQEVGDDMIDYHLNMYNAELMEERRKVLSEIIEDFGANNGANLPELSDDDLMSLDGQMRYIDYDYLGERASDSDMDIEGKPMMIDPSSNPQLAELRVLIAKEKERRGIEGVKVDNTSALLKDFFDSSEVEVPQDVIDRIREIEEQKKLGVLGQKSSMKMTDDGQGEFDFGESESEMPLSKRVELEQAGREVTLQQQAMDDILRNADETTSVSEMERRLRQYEKSRLR